MCRAAGEPQVPDSYEALIACVQQKRKSAIIEGEMEGQREEVETDRQGSIMSSETAGALMMTARRRLCAVVKSLHGCWHALAVLYDLSPRLSADIESITLLGNMYVQSHGSQLGRENEEINLATPLQLSHNTILRTAKTLDV